MDRPRLTALMPLRNYHRAYLEGSLRSLAQQTNPDWRLVIVVEPRDQAHFRQVLREALADTRVALIPNEGRKLSGAVNTGMRHATTDFVALLLGDDLWAPETVQVLSDAMAQHPDIDFFHSSRLIIDEHGNPISSIHPSKPMFTIEDFKHASPVKHLLCWRRHTALAFGGLDESLNSVGPDDYDFPWMMAERGARFRAIPECLYYYRDHREAYRLTTHLPLRVHTREIHRILKKHRVPWRERRRLVAGRKRRYLRQCLYQNTFDKWIKGLLGYDARRGWRESYR